jgi:hypothetical protein
MDENTLFIILSDKGIYLITSCFGSDSRADSGFGFGSGSRADSGFGSDFGSGSSHIFGSSHTSSSYTSPLFKVYMIVIILKINNNLCTTGSFVNRDPRKEDNITISIVYGIFIVYINQIKKIKNAVYIEIQFYLFIIENL